MARIDAGQGRDVAGDPAAPEVRLHIAVDDGDNFVEV
jgi:hypothetical protein